ncbi:MAG TPA: hypothetical protein VN805_03855 [Caulobacteraceae bacterium]|nr:hypothetical protein [Caulobacteraceae bacterium]
MTAPALRARYRIVTLLEILQDSANSFWFISGILGQAIVRMETEVFSTRGLQQVAASLGELDRETERLKLRSSQAQLARIKQYVADGHVSNNELRQLLVELVSRVMDDLSDQVFLSIPPENLRYFTPPAPLFGAAVEGRFAQMSEDIAEAGKCLALDRPTAAVFHLMRVMELANRALGSELGVQLAEEKNWQCILDEANKAIRALDQKDPKTKQFAEAAAHLYNVKLAWRNETMHPKQTYTPEEAEAIFNATKIFVSDLALLI